MPDPNREKKPRVPGVVTKEEQIELQQKHQMRKKKKTKNTPSLLKKKDVAELLARRRNASQRSDQNLVDTSRPFIRPRQSTPPTAKPSVLRSHPSIDTRRSNREVYGLLQTSGGIRNVIKRNYSATFIKLFNNYIETIKTYKKKQGVDNYFGLSADNDERAHLNGQMRSAYGIDLPPPLCDFCRQNTRQLELEHTVPYYTASAFIGLVNGSGNLAKSPIYENLYCYTCANCNRLKSNKMFIDVPSKDNSFKWKTNLKEIAKYAALRNKQLPPDQRIWVDFMIKRYNKTVDYLNGEQIDGHSLEKYYDYREIKQQMITNGFDTQKVESLNREEMLSIGNYLSGLESIKYYKCLNIKLRRVHGVNLKGVQEGNTGSAERFLNENILPDGCVDNEVERIINHFKNDFNTSYIVGGRGGPERRRNNFGKMVNLKRLKMDLKKLKLKIKVVLRNL